MRQKQINHPTISNRDVKVLGRVVSIARANKLAAAELVFDETFDYDSIDTYRLDQIIEFNDAAAGYDQYTINRLFGNKVKKLDDTFQIDENGWVQGINVKNLVVMNNLTVNGVDFSDIISRLSGLESWKDTVSDKLTEFEERIQVLEACCKEIHNKPDNSVELVVNPDPIEVLVGEDRGFTVSVNNEPIQTFTAVSSNTDIATIVEGYVHGVSAGTCSINITWGGITATVEVVVSNPAPTQYTVTFNSNGGTPSYDSQTVASGGKATNPGTPTKQGNTFNGWHKGTASGTTWNFNSSVTSNMTLVAGWTENEPEPIYPSSISIDGPNTVLVGNTITLTANITPSNADTDTTITWSSSDTSKATVNNGVVTGVAAGPVVITAATGTGNNISDTHNVTVNENTPTPTTVYVTGVTVEKSHNNTLLWSNDGTEIPNNRQSVTLTATVAPSNAYNTNVTWSCSDNNKVTLTSEGNTCIVTPRGDTDANGVKVYATSVGTKEDNTTARGEATIVIDLVTTPEEPTTQYKVSWQVNPAGAASVLNATTENGAYFNVNDALWNNWSTHLSASTGYNISSISVTMGENNVTNNYVSGMNISIPKSDITGDVMITIVCSEETPGVQHTVTWNVGEHAHVLNINTASALVNGGTVEHGAYFSMGVVADEGYELNTTTVTMGGSDITSQCVTRELGEDPTTHTSVIVDSIQILNVNGDVVITTTTTAVAPPAQQYTVTYTINGESAHVAVNNPTTLSGSSVTLGSAWTAEFVADTGYYITNKTATMGNTDISGTYGSMTNDASRFVINVTNVTDDIAISITVAKRSEYIVYTTNINDALYLNYGNAGQVPDDRRLTSNDFLTPCSLVTTDGIYNTPVVVDGDEAATFFTADGYVITNVTVSWDGEAPQWVTPGHNEFANVVTIDYNQYNGSFLVQEGIKSGGTVTITVAPES